MNILTDRKVKGLFCRVALLAAGFALLSAALAALLAERAALAVLAASAGMGLSVLAAMYWYFRDRHRVMEDAAARIGEYIAGDPAARIECDGEGELNRLFHEVNALVSILNAHAEREGSAKRFLKDTLSDISHQLKTPLAALNIYTGIIQEEAEDASAVREFAALSEQELERIEALVQTLLKLAKFDAGTVVLEKAEERVADMMERVQQRFAFQARREGKTLSLSGDGGVLLLCDRVWLMEAVGNLVKNALDHTEAGEEISVAWRGSPSLVQIVVKDNGCGIHPEDIYHIFKRFYRSRRSRDRQGVGLGLSLAKAVVEAHGGTIRVDSTLGAGTSFTISFLNPTKL